MGLLFILQAVSTILLWRFASSLKEKVTADIGYITY